MLSSKKMNPTVIVVGLKMACLTTLRAQEKGRSVSASGAGEVRVRCYSLLVDSIKNDGGSDVLGLDASGSESLLLGGEPRSSLGSVGQDEPGDDGESHGDESFREEDDAPCANHTETAALQET